MTVDKGPDALVAEYQPTEVGPHIVKIFDKTRNQHVAGSPYTCNVYDARKVSVSGLVAKQPVGKPLTFTVDASQAGEGKCYKIYHFTKKKLFLKTLVKILTVFFNSKRYP